jgi:hypothetical protein
MARPLDAQQAVEALNNLQEGDVVLVHMVADSILLDLLIREGYGDAVEAYFDARHRLKFGYA